MGEMMMPGGGMGMNPSSPVCPNGQFYTVKPGDTMFLIARQFNLPLSTLVAANPQIADPNMIFPGQMICIPAGGITPTCAGGFIYNVQTGDTMFQIARRFGITLEALIAANPQVANPDLIFPGQSICVPVQTPPMTCPNGSLYTVRAGDTMFDIATRYGLTLQQLIAANPQIQDPNRIFPGQVICLPAMAMPVPPAPVVISPIVSPPAIPAVPAVPAVPAIPAVPPLPMPCPPVMPAYPAMPYYAMPYPCPGQMPVTVEPCRGRRHRHHRHCR